MPTLFLTKEARIYNGTKTVASINGAEKTGLLHVKDEIRTISNTIQKDNSKQIKDVNVRPETMKLMRKTQAEHSVT